MILNAIVAKLKCRSKDFKGRHHEASLIIQAVSWYLRYPLGNVKGTNVPSVPAMMGDGLHLVRSPPVPARALSR